MSVMATVESQVITGIQQLIHANSDHMSEQAFICCGNMLRFYHFDTEGMAWSD